MLGGGKKQQHTDSAHAPVAHLDDGYHQQEESSLARGALRRQWRIADSLTTC